MSLPKINHLLRTSLPSFIADTAVAFDALIYTAFVSITGELPISIYPQLSLPIAAGGFGLRSAVAISLPAYIGSSMSCLDSITSFSPHVTYDYLTTLLTPLLTDFKTIIAGTSPDFSFSPTLLLDRKLQHELSDLIYLQQVTDFTSTLSFYDFHRFQSNCLNNTFLTCFPTAHSPFSLSTTEWTVLARLRLLSTVLSSSSKCPSCSRGVLDVSGHHAINCPGSIGMTHRHDTVKTVLASILRLTGHNVSLEKKIPGVPTLPGDIHITMFGSTDLYIDISIVDSLSGLSSASDNSPFDPTASLTKREKEKNDKHLSTCLDRNSAFIPFVVSSSGLFSAAASSFLHSVKNILLRKDIINPTRYIHDRILFALGKTMAQSIIFRGRNLVII